MNKSIEHYFGGYFLVKVYQRADCMDSVVLPEKIFSVSECICDIYPSFWALSWTTKTKDEINKVKKELDLNDKELLLLQKKIDYLFELKKFGWINAFSDLDSAVIFYKEYLNRMVDIKLLAIGLPSSYVNIFIERERPPEGVGMSGVYQNILKSEVISLTNKLGYEILGHDNGLIHSFICNALENDYIEKLNISFNKNGLIENYEDAIKATEYTNKDDVGAEPGTWLPWMIYEVDIPS